MVHGVSDIVTLLNMTWKFVFEKKNGRFVTCLFFVQIHCMDSKLSVLYIRSRKIDYCINMSLLLVGYHGRVNNMTKSK